MNKLLHIFIAALGTIKKSAHKAQTNLHRLGSKAENYKGHNKTYEPLREADAYNPSDDTKAVPTTASKVLQRYQDIMSEEWDLELTVRGGNQLASADLVVDGVCLVEAAPASWLLYYETQLREIRKFVEEMPVLASAVRWESVPGRDGVYRSPVTKRAVTRKVQEALVLLPSTEHQQGQAERIVRDVIIGSWHQEDFASALTNDEKEDLLRRIDVLAIATKEARLKANSTEVPRRYAASALCDYIFQPDK